MISPVHTCRGSNGKRKSDSGVPVKELQRVYAQSQGSDLHQNGTSHMDYASAVWDPHKQKDIQLLEKVQRRADRYVHNYTDISPGTVTGQA